MTRLNIKDFDINTLQLLMHCVMKCSRVVDVRDLVNRTEQCRGGHSCEVSETQKDA